MIYSLPLKNGVRLLAEPAEQALSAAIGFWFPYGSRDESVRGAAHFIEHMLFKGTDEHSPFEIAAEFDRSGGYINAFTEHETVCLHCLVPASYAERALKLLCEAAARSIFDPREFEKERSVIASEIVAALDDPEEYAQDAFFKAAYPRSPLSRPIAGTLRDVNALERGEVFELYKRRFLNGPLAVSAAGNFSVENAAALIENLLPLRETCAPPLTAREKTDAIQCGDFFLPARFEQAQYLWGYQIPRSFNKRDYYIWEIINTITGSAVTSRLFQRLREKTGLCYTIYSGVSFFRDAGLWSAYASCPENKIEETARLAAEEMNALYENGITSEEIDCAKEHCLGETTLALEDAEYRMKRLAREYFFSGSVTPADESAALFAGVGREEVSRAIKDVFRNDRKTALLVSARKPRGTAGKTYTKIKKSKIGARRAPKRKPNSA